MNVRRICFLLTVLLLVAFPFTRGRSQPESSEESNKPKNTVARENLVGCWASNGILILPSSSSTFFEVLGGNVFGFEERELVVDPYTKKGLKPKSYEEFRQSLLKQEVGDIFFESRNGTYFVSPTGYISDLGKHYLYELDAKHISIKKHNGRDSTGYGGDGLMPGVKLGHCYDVYTTDAHHVLFRVISLTEEEVAIQWILSPNRIPKSKPIEPEAERVPFVPLELRWDTDVVKNIDRHVACRRLLVERLIKVATDEKVNYSLREEAIDLLGKMRAVEAVDDLIGIVDYWNRNASMRAFNPRFAAAEALIKIGKPASLKAVEAIKDPNNPIREGLLIRVIVMVEGPKVAGIMLEDGAAREMKLAGKNPKNDNPHKIAADNLRKSIDRLKRLYSLER